MKEFVFVQDPSSGHGPRVKYTRYNFSHPMGTSRKPSFRTKKSLGELYTDYSHVYRRKTTWELIRLSMTVVGIEFTYSAITSFVSPILLEMGIKYENMSMVWAMSPIIGFFLSPVMGSLSDRCSLNFGRRRPFIVIFAIFNLLGLLLIPFGESLSSSAKEHRHLWLNMQHSTLHLIAVIVTIVGVVIADYTSDALQSPSRAYLLDLCRADDQARGLTTFTVMGGIGGFFGYLLGAFDWRNTTLYDSAFRGNAFDGHVHMFFTLAAIFSSICIIISITTLKEVPLNVIDNMRLNTGVRIELEDGCLEQFQDLKAVTGEKSYGTADEKSLITQEGHPTFMTYVTSMLHMPYSLKILCLTNLICWMAHSCYTLYFTDFVGTVVFGGASDASAGTLEKHLYEEGVKFGCLCMAVFSLSCTTFSIVIETLIKFLGLRCVYMCGILIDAIALLLMVLIKSKIAVLLLSAGCGILYSIMFTIPYILLAHYHDTNVFAVDGFGVPVPHQQIRGLGTDISLISACIFIAQFILSLLTSVVVHYTASPTAVLLTGSFLAIAAFICAAKIVYLDM